MINEPRGKNIRCPYCMFNYKPRGLKNHFNGHHRDEFDLEEGEYPEELLKTISTSPKYEGASGDPTQVPEVVKEHVRKRDKHECRRCGESVREDDSINDETHHLFPNGAGGSNHPENLLTLCPECHTEAHSEMSELRKKSPEVLDSLRDLVCGRS